MGQKFAVKCYEWEMTTKTIYFSIAIETCNIMLNFQKFIGVSSWNQNKMHQVYNDQLKVFKTAYVVWSSD